MKIVNEFKNDLLKRKEIQFSIGAEKNPGFEGAMKALVDEFKVSEDSVVVKNIKNNFGKKEFFVEAFIYNTKEDKVSTERRVKVKKTDAVARGAR